MAAEAQKENISRNAEEGNAGDARADTATAGRRERSRIEFPYTNLEDAEEAARDIFGAAGTTELTAAQVGAAIHTSPDSSTFRVRVSAMRMFGLLEIEQNRYRLTDLGRQISETDSSKDARVRAFLKVELYAQVKIHHDGKTVPKAGALEREFIQWGVASKQAFRARQVFDKSAKHAGFLKLGSDRFVTPILTDKVDIQESDKSGDQDDRNSATKVKFGGSGGGGMRGGDHLIIKGLVQELPAIGETWETEDRINWLRLAENAFNLIYKGNSRIKIEQES